MKIKGLEAWVEKLGKTEMPVLANVVQELNELTGDDDTEINQLAEVVLRDANLTSQVLRIANSVMYNPSSFPINTVSRAIVLIGFGGVRAICISVMIIDSLLGKQPRERLLKQMAFGFHSAVQARTLVGKTNDSSREEVFIAGLLYHLSELAFWSSGGVLADELEERLQAADPNEQGSVAEQVLGCSFKSITRALAVNWKLGETLEQSLYPAKSPSPKVSAVCLGEEITQATRYGWDSSEMEAVLQRVSKFTGQGYREVRQRAEAAAEEAAAVALAFGAPQVCHLIPGRRRLEQSDSELQQPEPLQPNPDLQLSVLRDLSNALLEHLDVNAVFQMVLEGLHRGIGLERVVLGFVQGGRVSAKFVLGQGTEKWRDKFNFSVARTEENIFTEAIRKQQPQWYGADYMEQHKRRCNPEIRQVVGCYPAFVAGIFLGKRCIALFYADRCQSGGALGEDQFQSFRHFMIQTEMSLRLISERRAR